jgi:hypothetical protein
MFAPYNTIKSDEGSFIMSIASLYTDEVKKNFKVLYANWEPGGPIGLGDYGIMQRNIFIPMGNIKKDYDEFKGNVIQFASDPTRDSKEFKSETGVEVNLMAKGSVNPQGVTLAKATLDIKFAQKNTIFFNASGCTTDRIANKAKIGVILKQLLKEGKWKKEYCVVTDLVSAERTIIAISEGESSGIQFEAESPALEKINLADASIKLSLNAEKNVGYKVPADEGLNLLIGLCKIKNPFLWWGGEFQSRTLKMTKEMSYAIENAPGIKTEETVDELVFAQMGKD